jgi:hypothetical protein
MQSAAVTRVRPVLLGNPVKTMPRMRSSASHRLGAFRSRSSARGLSRIAPHGDAALTSGGQPSMNGSRARPNDARHLGPVGRDQARLLLGRIRSQRAATSLGSLRARTRPGNESSRAAMTGARKPPTRRLRQSPLPDSNRRALPYHGSRASAARRATMRKPLHSARVQVPQSGQALARVGTLRYPLITRAPCTRVGRATARIRRRGVAVRDKGREMATEDWQQILGALADAKRSLATAWRILDGTDGAAPGVEHAFSAALAASMPSMRSST